MPVSFSSTAETREYVVSSEEEEEDPRFLPEQFQDDDEVDFIQFLYVRKRERKERKVMMRKCWGRLTDGLLKMHYINERMIIRLYAEDYRADMLQQYNTAFAANLMEWE